MQRTLNGISAHSREDGQLAFGRHASTIRMGRNLWQTAPLNDREQEGIAERFFDDGSLPTVKESKAAFDSAMKKGVDRPAPFQSKTLPYLHLTTFDYGKRIQDWFEALRQEQMQPAEEDMKVLQQVADRVLIEFRLEKELNQ